MLEKRTPIPVTEAIDKCLKYAKHKSATKKYYTDSLGDTLAEDIIATYDIPMFDKSPYDGFAIVSGSSEGATGDERKSFKVIDHIGAGHVSDVQLKDNEAVRIMTGAPIPKGADAVVMLEQTTPTEDGFTLRKTFTPGENISKQGEECKQGEVVIPKGTKITCRGYSGSCDVFV